MSAERILLELVGALRAQYVKDPSGPGVHVAQLPNGACYASVKRFTEQYGKGEFVVCSASASTLGGTLASLANKWLAKGGRHLALASAVLEHAQEEEARSQQ